MTVYRQDLNISTRSGGLTDISADINAIIARSGVTVGICHIFNQGSTGIVGSMEFEPGLEVDLPEVLNKLIPPGRNYAHEIRWPDGNGHSHIQATILGPEITVPVENGMLKTGVWQQIFHYEADVKPRKREITVTVIGE